MIILLWFLTLILFVFLSAIIINALLRINHENNQNAYHTFIQGMKEALKGCGFVFNQKLYSVELYKWVAQEDDEVCEDCLERASWPAMDIADWMKVGLPNTKEASTHCKDNCRCELTLHKSEIRTTNS